MAPRDGFEPPTKWLIPPLAGLYQLQKAGYPALFNMSFPDDRFTAYVVLFSPNKIPWPGETFSSLASRIVTIIVLVYPASEIACASAVVSSGRIAFQDIYLVRHKLTISGSPGRIRTADKVVNSHLLYQLSYRGTQCRNRLCGLFITVSMRIS